MGFKVGRRFELDFEGTAIGGADGAKVVMRSASIGEIRKMREVDLDEECEIVASKIIEWNLEDEEGNPIPKTKDGILSLEEPLRDLIVTEWLKATRGISAPLDLRSSDTEQSAEPVSIPMETL